MNSMLRFVATALAVAAPLSSAICAPPQVITPQTQAAIGTPPVQVIVAQAELKTDIVQSNLAVVTGGGILGGLLAASQNASRAKQAEAAIEPVRAALIGYDADALALRTTRSAFANVSWLRPQAVTISKDGSEAGRLALLDGAAGPQVLFVDYTYDLTPDFRSVRVVAELRLVNRAAAKPADKPAARLANKQLAYLQTVRGVVTLPNATDKKVDNAALWSASGGQPIRTALTSAFEMVGTLIPRALALSDADVKAMTAKDRPKVVVGGFAGRRQPDTGGGTLIWANGYLLERPLSGS